MPKRPLAASWLRLEWAGALLDAARYEAAAQVLLTALDTGDAAPEIDYLLAALGRLGHVPQAIAQKAALSVEAHAQKARRLFDCQDPIDEMVGHLKAHGFVFLRRFLKQEETAVFAERAQAARQLDEDDVGLLQDPLKRSPLAPLMQEHLGDHLLFHESYFKLSDGTAGVTWHQDGRTTNESRNYVTCWVPFTACGRDVPALEVVTCRFTSFFPFRHYPLPKPPYGPYRWSIDESLLLPTSIWTPPLRTGRLAHL